MPVLIQELVKRGKIDVATAQKLEDELKISAKTEEDLLLEKNIFTQEELFILKGEILDVPFYKDAETLEIPN